jgi:hypothetical protein
MLKETKMPTNPKRAPRKLAPISTTSPAPVVEPPVQYEPMRVAPEKPKTSHHFNWAILVVVSLAIVSGLLISFQKFKTDEEILTLQGPFPNRIETVDTKDWKTYKDEEQGIEFKYPKNFTLDESSSGVSLMHEVSFKHLDPCDLRDGMHELDSITDFNAKLQLLPANAEGAVKKTYASPADVIKNNKPILSEGFVEEYSAGDLKGFKIRLGAEGCGIETYYFEISSKQTLVVERHFDSTRTFGVIGVNNQFKTSAQILALPQIISPENEMEMFDLVLSSVEVSSSVDVTGWKTYKSSNYGFEFMYPKDWLVINETGMINVYSPQYFQRFQQAKDEKWLEFPPSNIQIIVTNKISIIASNLGVSNVTSIEQIAESSSGGLLSDIKKITFAGEDSYKGKVSGLRDMETIFFKKDTLYYQLILDRQYNPDISSESTLLSTFKFTK